MKNFLTLIIIFVSIPVYAEVVDDESECMSFVKIGDNYKKGHRNISCQNAANAGVGSAQYAVGVGYGYAGDSTQELKYLRLSANNRNIAAYLSLGHALRNKEPWESIYWYQRYVATNAQGYGYAALLISDVFKELGDSAQSKYWREVCMKSPYQGCTK